MDSELRVTNWTGLPMTPIKLSEMGGGGGGGGHPDSIIIFASNTIPLAPGSAGWISIGTPMWAGREGADNNGRMGVMAMILQVTDEFGEGDGSQWGLPNGAIYTGNIFDYPLLVQIAVPLPDGATSPPPGWRVGVDITALIHYNPPGGSVDDPPSGPPDGIYPPTNLVASSNGDHIHLSWVDNSSNELGFAIEWSSVPPAVWQEFAQVSANSTTYDDFDIEAGELYSYRVYAFKTNRSSIYSNIAQTDETLLISPSHGPLTGGTLFTVAGAITGSVPIPAETSVRVLFDGVEASDAEVVLQEVDEEPEGRLVITGRTPEHAIGFVDVVIEFNEEEIEISDAFEFRELGAQYPHIVTVEQQNLSPPLPSTLLLWARVEDDPDGIFNNSPWYWELVNHPHYPLNNVDPLTGELKGAKIHPDGTITVLPGTIPPPPFVRIHNDRRPETYVTIGEPDQGRLLPGSYLFRVSTAGRNSGDQEVELTTTVLVQVQAAGAPVVHSETHVVRFPDSITLSPRVEDSGMNGALTFFWSQTSGPEPAIISSPNSQNTEIQFSASQGSYTFELRVSNSKFTGRGIIKVYNQSAGGAAPPQDILSDLTITINGTEY